MIKTIKVDGSSNYFIDNRSESIMLNREFDPKKEYMDLVIDQQRISHKDIVVEFGGQIVVQQGRDKLIIDDDEEIKKLSTCEGILGDKIIDIIQSLVNIVRVAIPIVLIVYGIIDFGKAAFSFDESEMKKAQGKFIKRLIIGITFFLIPVVIGILLKVGHMVWGDVIGTSICGIEF